MNRRTNVICYCLLVAALAVQPSFADIIVMNLTAQIDEISNPAIFNNELSVGDIITGGYLYDSDTPDTDAFNQEDIGRYQHSGSPYGAFLAAGSFDFETDLDNVNFLILIDNDQAEGDTYGFFSYNNTSLNETTDVDFISWYIRDSSGIALSSDALPLTAPVLADWDENRLDIDLSVDGGCPFRALSAHVTSVQLIPEPVTVSLFALGALVLRRQRHQAATQMKDRKPVQVHDGEKTK